MPLHPGADNKRACKRIILCCENSVARFFVIATASLFLPLALFGQDDAGSSEKELFGNGVAVSVTVHDDSGSPIPVPATVNLLRGTIPSGRAETSNGNAMLVVNAVGDFTVVVSAPGFREGREYFSAHGAGRAQVDVFLKRLANDAPAAGVPGRPLLAPKAKEALDKGLLALSSGKTREAEKEIAQAMKFAPGHPDVLYAQGILRINQHDFPEAQSALEKATQVDPAHARAFAALGMALCDQAKYDLAVAPLEKSLQLDPTGSWETRWALAKSYYQTGQYPAALKMSQDALSRSNGNQPQLRLLLAQALTAVGSYDDAAQTLRAVIHDLPDTKEAATARRWLNALTADGKIRPAQDFLAQGKQKPN
jgi:thioredoxin-like negative regulator of GroEL